VDELAETAAAPGGWGQPPPRGRATATRDL